METLKNILSIPALIYINAFKNILNKQHPLYYRGATCINFIILNFWLIQPFIAIPLSIDAVLTLSALFLTCFMVSLSYDILETQKRHKELRADQKAIMDKMDEILEEKRRYE